MRKITDPWEVSQDRLDSFDEAVLFLKNWLTQTMSQDEPDKSMLEIITKMIKENPTEWWVGHHFGWGMGIRNLLRENGHGEKELGVDNLDDHYIPLIERACLNHHIFFDESTTTE